MSDPRDASTRGLPRLWQRTDEWYGFATSPVAPCASSRRSTRRATRPATARWAATTRSPGRTSTRAAAPGTRPGGTRGSRTPRSVPRPPPRRHPLGRRAAGRPLATRRRPGRPTRRHGHRGEVHPLQCRAACPPRRPLRRGAAPHRGRDVRRPDRDPAARSLDLRRDGPERGERTPGDPDGNCSHRLAPRHGGSARRRARSDGARRRTPRTRPGTPRAAARRTTGQRATSAVEHCGQAVGRSSSCVLEVPRDVPAGRTEGDPVAERPAPLLLDPVPLRHGRL